MSDAPQWVELARRARDSNILGRPLTSIEAVIGRVDRRYFHRRATERIPLEELAAHCPASDESPVLILGAGWRSGSTLLQRLTISSGDVLLWGEPWNRSQPIRSLADQLGAISPSWLQQLPGHIEPTDADLAEKWVANLFPAVSDLFAAHQQYLLSLLRDPARAAGFDQWGLKEVRLDGSDLHYLTTLFPRARVIVVHRDPRDAWASYRAMGFRSYRRWPGREVDTARQFAANWAQLAGSLVRAADERGALVVRYDELRTDDTLAAVAAHLDLAIKRSVAAERVGGAAPGIGPSRGERWIIERVAGETMAELGYD